MIEIILFAMAMGIGGAVIVFLLGLPEVVAMGWLLVVFVLLLPGLYAAFAGAPFVPSNRKRQRTMLKLAELTGSETVYDLGCGDSRFLRASAPLAKKAIGYELSIPLVILGKWISLFNPKITVEWKDIWKQNYDDADVIFCYLLPKMMRRFYKEVWPKLKPGTKVICNAFTLKELKPVRQEEKVYVYVK